MGVKNTVHHTNLTPRGHYIQNAIIYVCCAIAAGFGITMALSATGVI